MLNRSLKQGSGFGVVGLLAGQEVGAAATHCAELGCEALIRDWENCPMVCWASASKVAGAFVSAPPRCRPISYC